MGGSVALTLREPNGTEHRMCRWTNILPWAITNLGLIEDRPEHLTEMLEQWTSMRGDWARHRAEGVPCEHNMTSVYAPYPFLAPIDYGLVLVDGVHRVILTRQGYTAIGAISPLSVVRGDPADPESAAHRYIALFDAGRIEATAPGRRVKSKVGVSGAESIRGLQACYAQHGYRPFEEFDFRVDMSPYTVENFEGRPWRQVRERVLALGFALTPEEEALWAAAIAREDEDRESAES